MDARGQKGSKSFKVGFVEASDTLSELPEGLVGLQGQLGKL